MLTPAHIASSYLLSQAPSLLGFHLTTSEVLAVVIAGNVLDIDFFFGAYLGKKGDEHHNFITHTPVFVFIVWIAIIIIFPQYFSQFVLGMILISLLLHLIFDDIGYWFCKFGWQKISQYPQINWAYPFTKFAKRAYKKTNKQLLYSYLNEARVNVIMEVLLIIFALALWFYNN